MKDSTLLSSIGYKSVSSPTPVNTPVYRASTFIYPSVAALENRHGDVYREVCYGAMGTPSSFALAEAVCALEHGAGSAVTSSGLAACTQAILPFVSQGDHILVSDSVYGPTRTFCDTILHRFGVETSYYDPQWGTDLEALFQPNTRLVFTEAPGSLSFEMQDIPAIAAVAHAHNCVVLMDNTWAGPLYFRALEHGVDISILAATKYLSGHSDVVLGVITARTEAQFRKLKGSLITMGEIASPDDCYLILRGMRTMAVRMKAQQESALKAAAWFQARPEVEQVLYPPLPGAPGHELWKRDFQGAGSVFGVLFPKLRQEQIAAMLEHYQHFRIGASWGGFESLVITCHPGTSRTARPWDEEKHTLIRFAIGLEDVDDLLADLADGLERLKKA